MAEKPRIKETNEIFSSIDKKRGRKQQPDLVQSDILPPPILPVPENGEGESPPSSGKRRGRPRKNTAPGSPVSPGEEPVSQREPAPSPEEPADRNPLDFSKYALPQTTGKRRGRPRKNADFQSPPELDLTRTVPLRESSPPVEMVAAPPRSEAPSVVEVPQKTKILRSDEAPYRSFDFEDLEARQREEESQRRRDEEERLRRLAEREAQQEQEEVDRLRRQAAAAADRARKQADEKAALRLREAEAEAERARQEAEQEAERLLREAEAEAERLRMEKESRRKLLEDNSYRDNVMDQLSDQFEKQFSQKFENRGGPDSGGNRPWWLEERREGLGKPVHPDLPQLELPEEETADPAARREEIRLQAERQTAGQHRPEPEPQVRREPSRESPAQASAEQRREANSLPAISPDGEREAEQEADHFMLMFEQEIIREEAPKEEAFRETLAQKFMRERERYLRELGIAEQMEAEQAAREEQARIQAEQEAQPVPPRRKLDFQIRPEMHLQPGEPEPPKAPPQPLPSLDAISQLANPAGPEAVPPPVTYNRAAQAVPQTAATEPAPGFSAPYAEITGKKSAEQLLLELGEQQKRRTRIPGSGSKPVQTRFRFTPVSEEGKAEISEESRGEKRPRNKVMPRVVILSACIGLAALSLIALAITTALERVADLAGGESVPISDASGEMLTAYENFNPDSPVYRSDVTVKRSGLTLSNLEVENRIVVDEEASAEGYLTLNSVTVGGLIYVNSSGINQLNLNDVRAERIVVNNEKHGVTIHTSGATDISAVEARTPVTLEQGEMANEAPGIRSLTVSGDDGNPLEIGVGAATLQSLTTRGETSLRFDGASVENMSSDGDLTLAGSGRVSELNFGINLGGGAAAEPVQALPATILVKGVEIGRLNIKSPSNVNLNAQADSVYSSDPVILGGNGTVGSLVFNEKFGNGRLAVDINGLNIQHLITNAEALIYSNGSSVINTLTANKSTYALGNKVNLLEAKSDGVIYENEPDVKRVAQGVDPPQSKEDNPNLNYSLSYDFSTDSGEEPLTDATESNVATTCNHAREVGGYVVGNGSKSNPFLVETAAQLAHVALHPSSHFLQTADIDIADDSGYVDGFPAITERFSGVYDGGGYCIRNLRIYSGGDNVALFAENIGVIKNLHIESGEVNTDSTSFVGALVGMNYQGGTVESCSNGASVIAESATYTGGLVGYNYGGKVRDCYNTGRVSGGDASGGLVGMNSQDASVTGSYNAGVVEGGNRVGAVAGINEAVVTNCYYLSGEDMDGIGSGEGNAVEKSSDQLSDSRMAAELAAGDDASLWQSGDENYAYPRLKKPVNLDDRDD